MGASLRHRKSVDKLEPSELADLRKAFAEAMDLDDERGFWYFAGWHGEPFGWCQHHTDLFLPWHRAYLYYLELALQERVPGVTLPWWDWTRESGPPTAYAEDDAADGQPNPLLARRVRVYRSGVDQQAPPREPGQAATEGKVPPLPYDSRWERAMQADTFESFQRAIESIHDDVHVWTGGIMASVQWAGYDPLFFAHHAMVDRAWRIWQYRHPGALPRQGLLDVALQPNGITVRQTLDVEQLGYEYAGTSTCVGGTI